MRTFKQFLKEDTLTSTMSEILVAKYKKDFSDWPLTHPLARIDSRNITLPQIMKPRLISRFNNPNGSVARTSMVQILLNSQESWKDVPDRGYSVFTSSAPGEGTYAKQNKSFSGTIAVIPKNGAMCAMIPDDFNKAKVPIGSETMELWKIFRGSEIIYSLMDEVHFLDRNIRFKAPHVNFDDDIPTAVKVYDYLLEHLPEEKRQALKRRFGYLKIFLQKVTSNKIPPNKLGIKTFTPDTYKPPVKPQEIWFNDDYLAIPIDKYDEFVTLVSAN